MTILRMYPDGVLGMATGIMQAAFGGASPGHLSMEEEKRRTRAALTALDCLTETWQMHEAQGLPRVVRGDVGTMVYLPTVDGLCVLAEALEEWVAWARSRGSVDAAETARRTELLETLAQALHSVARVAQAEAKERDA